MTKNSLQIWRNNHFSAWRPNVWDFVAMLVVFSIFIALAWSTKQMATPYKVGQALQIHLGAKYLPGYAMRTVLRMLLAMIVSLIFTFVTGVLAAKNKHAERVIIPLIDVLQSVPVIGYLSITVAGFIALFPGSLMGPELAVIFVLFTAQAWNMMLGFYQSLRTLPKNLSEAADIFQLSPWQRFWRVEVPFAMPSLIWNMMLSMSASWFFVVASEAITVNNQTILLPGIGSYIAVAIQHADKFAVFLSIITMLIVIVLYDQVFFRPIVCWGNKFKSDVNVGDENAPKSWLVTLLLRTRLLHYFGRTMALLLNTIINLRFSKPRETYPTLKRTKKRAQLAFVSSWYLIIFIICAVGSFALLHFIFHQVTVHEALHVLLFGLYTSIRVLVLLIISSLIWVPIGVWIGLRPNVTKYAQPIVQILAAFPANLLFPLFVILIVAFHLNVNIWATPLMLLGAQWYILFNVIAGASAIPKDLHDVAEVCGLSKNKWLWWQRFILPGIFPYLVTGAITAAGGAWNASIVAEVLNWGKHHLVAEGLGAYITEFTNRGDFPRVALGLAVMCVFVLTFNRIIWQPLYNLAQKRFQLD